MASLIGIHPRSDQVVEIVTFGAYGSGYRISNRLIITARHVIEHSDGPVTVRLSTGSVQANLLAEVAWQAQSPDIDVALLLLQTDVPGQFVAPVVLGDLRQTALGQVGFQTIGFPAHKSRALADGTVLRDTDHVGGTIPAGANAKTGILDLLHQSRTHTRGRDWSGMSGAAVFALDHLVGVVVEAERADTPLRAVPLALAGGWRDAREGVPEPRASAAKFRQLLEAEGLQLGLEPVRRRTPYDTRVREISEHCGRLVGRETELGLLAGFAQSAEGYQWWTGPAVSGKTALAVHFVRHPPEGVDVVAYFVPRLGDRDVMSFAKAVCDQLAALLDVPAPSVVQREHLTELWDQAVTQARSSGRHLVLVVDGLEDDAEDPPFTTQLPKSVGSYAHVLLFSRPLPRNAIASPLGHPIRSEMQCPEVALARSPQATLLGTVIPGSRKAESLPLDRLGDLDATLAEIDEVLEADPEEFIHKYVQVEGNGGDQYDALLELAVQLHGYPLVIELMTFLSAETKGKRASVLHRMLDQLLSAVKNRFGSEVADTFSSLFYDVEDLRKICKHFDARRRQSAAPAKDFGRPQFGADALEQQGRQLLYTRNYSEARSVISRAAKLDPARADRLEREFGFLALSQPDLGLVTGLWSTLAISNEFPLRSGPSQPIRDITDAFNQDAEPASTAGRTSERLNERQQATSQVSRDATVENSLLELLESLFVLESEHQLTAIGWLGRRVAGAEFSEPLYLDCCAQAEGNVRCHVELHDPGRPLLPEDLAESIFRQAFTNQASKLDHFIIISPRYGPDERLAAMLVDWQTREPYPFSLQIWCPENGVDALIARWPALYHQIYGISPSLKMHAASPEDDLTTWRMRLAPRLRLSERWQKYVQEADLHCLRNEDPLHFDDVYRRQVELRAMNGHGRPFEGSLIEQIQEWLGSSEPSILLLGEFGEGKSFFTYSLSRRLCEALWRRPDQGIIPLRLPLRDLRPAGGPHQLLQWRLSELGVDLASWQKLAKKFHTLVILDGFDEMSVELTPQAVTENIRDLSRCYREFAASKVLITSRGRFFDGGRDQERLLDRIGRPRTLYIAPVPRRQRLRYLESTAENPEASSSVKRLHSMYDPIGLAAKPLFLQMIRETLSNLPRGEFSELILYNTWVDESLRRKIEFLDDPDYSVLQDELLDNVKAILEDIAVELHHSHASCVFLKDFAGRAQPGIAKLLWRIRDGSAEADTDPVRDADATARIGIRSLLKAVNMDPIERWPVDFFHRSMREYFVGRAIVNALRMDESKARQLLTKIPLQPEITRYAGELLQELGTDEVAHRLEGLALSARSAQSDRLGGNSITLLYACQPRLVRKDWSGLHLDHAWLPDADLSGMNFTGTSLQHANLDNTNLEDSNFTSADLTGVRLEETARVLAVTTSGPERIFAAYEDRSVREWILHPGSRHEVRTIADLPHSVERLQISPSGSLIAIGGSQLSILTSGLQRWNIISTFKIKSRFRPPTVDDNSTLVIEESTSGSARLIRYNPYDGGCYWTYTLNDYGDSAQLANRAYLVSTEYGIIVLTHGTDGTLDSLLIRDRNVSCIAVSAPSEQELLIATGHHDGTIRLYRILFGSRGSTIEEEWTKTIHNGMISCLSFLGDEHLISGGFDKAVCVIPIESGPAHEQDIRRLYLSIRCRGIKYDGVRGTVERERLRQLAAAASSA